MKDEEIRLHLIAALEEETEKIRIFEEMPMGKARCDLFSVTTELTGYEIKSDNDSYQRLSNQIPYYDKYFDRNYLVVGKKHKTSAGKKIPDHWGLICFVEDAATEKISMEVIRLSEKNPKVSQRAQLNLLWRQELKNILKRHRMPLFSQSRKYVLITNLIKKLPSAHLQSEICEELFQRDYTME